MSAVSGLLALALSAAPLAQFDWFEYAGHDSVLESSLPAASYRNPVLAGFYPDPSITRVGDEYYLVNSTFTYFPGIPVFRSHDLVQWQLIGHVIDRTGQLNFDGLGVSRGVFAPTIRFHGGYFYVVSTAVDSGGNFISVARDPAGPWSDPKFFPGLDGIDPSLFFDGDKAYLLNNGPPDGPPQYDGHRAIWMQEFDPATLRLTGPRKVLVNGGVDFATKPVWIEGPHMYRHDGWYILMCAEGGTSLQHSEVVFRSRSPWGPFEPYSGNPILTQRDLPADRPHPIINAGHADLVETNEGRWWAVFLASRAYGSVHYNTGRETFLLPVTWRNGWPIILDRGAAVPYVVPAPPSVSNATSSLALTGNFTLRDEFDSPVLNQQWSFVRVPSAPWVDLVSRPGWLTIHALPTSLGELRNMSFLARRQQHMAFDASTELQVASESALAAGLAAFQNETHWFFLAVRDGSVFLERRSGAQLETLARAPLASTAETVRLRISGDGGEYSFYFDDTGGRWKPLKEGEDGTLLSTDVAGGFVGSFVGPYARTE